MNMNKKLYKRIITMVNNVMNNLAEEERTDEEFIKDYLLSDLYDEINILRAYEVITADEVHKAFDLIDALMESKMEDYFEFDIED